MIAEEMSDAPHSGAPDREEGYAVKTAFRTLLVIGVGAEIALLVFTAVSSSLSVWWVPVPLTVVAAALALLFTGMVVDRRWAGSLAVSLSATAARFGVPRKALALLVSEVRSPRSSAGVFSRPVVPAGDEAHPGHRNLRTVILLVLGLVAVEIVVVHLAVPSRFWRILLFILSVYALILLLGFYTSVRRNPHLLTPRGLRLRHGDRFVCEIPWKNLDSAWAVRPGQGGDLVIDDDGEARVPVLSEVNVRLEMDPPVTAEDLHKGAVDVTAIEFYCDDRDVFLDAVARMRP